MTLLTTFLTSAIKAVVFTGVITAAVIVGKKLRDYKDAKDASGQ